VALGDVLGRFAHRLGRVALRHPRVDEPPAERRVEHRLLSARQPRGGLRHHPRRAAHRLDAAGQIEVALPEPQGARGLVDRLEAGSAEPVHGHAGDLDRQSGEQRGHPGDVAVVLAGLVRGSEVDVDDLARIDARALDGAGDRERPEIVGTDAGERAAMAPHRRAHGVDDQRLGHGEIFARPSCAG
jgi:hypothetical protein